MAKGSQIKIVIVLTLSSADELIANCRRCSEQQKMFCGTDTPMIVENFGRGAVTHNITLEIKHRELMID
jgi:hypothetical protein